MQRILHSLHELDDGKFHKVANIVGHTMNAPTQEPVHQRRARRLGQ